MDLALPSTGTRPSFLTLTCLTRCQALSPSALLGVGAFGIPDGARAREQERDLARCAAVRLAAVCRVSANDIANRRSKAMTRRPRRFPSSRPDAALCPARTALPGNRSAAAENLSMAASLRLTGAELDQLLERWTLKACVDRLRLRLNPAVPRDLQLRVSRQRDRETWLSP